MTKPKYPRFFQDIKNFHEKFGLEYKNGPRQLPQNLQDFRTGFLNEELTEYKTSVFCKDKEGQFDALIDLVYVAMGTAYLHGFDFEEGWKRVHAANMKKVRAKSKDQSKRGTKYDVVKPLGWTAPDLSDLVKKNKVVKK